MLLCGLCYTEYTYSNFEWSSTAIVACPWTEALISEEANTNGRMFFHHNDCFLCNKTMFAVLISIVLQHVGKFVWICTRSSEDLKFGAGSRPHIT